jgi:hypothetical protein
MLRVDPREIALIGLTFDLRDGLDGAMPLPPR